MSIERILVINGPNLNLLGTREPEVYGTSTLDDLEATVTSWGADLGVAVETFQSNHEGAIIDRLHQASDLDGVVINPGALSHYSYAIHDALLAIAPPAVEVHISNVKARDAWRRHSVTAPACKYVIYGRGIRGYRDAILHLIHHDTWPGMTLPYGEDHDRIGDLRVPDGQGPHPVAVVIHGGFWTAPWTRDLMDGIAVDLARRGWATWNPEYRRVGLGGGWPTTFEDVTTAIDALTNLAPDYPISTTDVVLIGHSAGAQLALWAAARTPLASQPAPATIIPKAVVALAPVADLADAYRRDLDAGAVEAFLRRSPDEAPDRYAAASPIELLPLGIPQLIVHGDADSHVPVEMSREYAGAAADAGDRVIYEELMDVDHFQLIDPGSEAWSRVVASLDALLGLE